MRPAFPLALLAVLAAPGLAAAGSPLLCWPVEVGDAEVPDLLEGDGWSARRGPEPSLAAVLAYLETDAPVPARMEAIRRGVVATWGGGGPDDALLEALVARAEAVDAPALSWLDAGYCGSIVAEISASPRARAGEAYAWILRAREARPRDAGIELAAAWVTYLGNAGEDGAHVRHVAAALRLAPDPESPVRRNLMSYFSDSVEEAWRLEAEEPGGDGAAEGPGGAGPAGAAAPSPAERWPLDPALPVGAALAGLLGLGLVTATRLARAR